MQNVTKEVRNGLKVTVPSPTDVAEFDTLAKRSGACLDEASANVWYRSVLPEFWYWMAAAVAQKYGAARPMVNNKKGDTYKEGDRKGQVIQVPEHSDPQFVDFVAAQQGVSAVAFQPLADEVCAMVGPQTNMFGVADSSLADGERLVAFDPSAAERKERTNEPGKDDLLTAQGLVEQTPKNLKISLKKIAQVTGVEVNLVPADESDAAAKNLRIVALAVKAFKKAVAEQAKAGLKA